MIFLLVLVAMVAWLFVRKNLPTNYQQPGLMAILALLIFLPILLPKLVDIQWAHSTLWPLAGGVIIGEASLKWWAKLKALNERFIHPHGKSTSKSSQKRSSSRTSTSQKKDSQ